jgi:hypothetical protein
MYTFDLQPGNTYRLTFDLAGAHRPWKGSESNTVYISLGYYFSTFHTMGRWDPFQTFVHDFTVDDPGLANLKFDHMGNDHVGLLLDNVSLSMVVPDGPIIVDPPEQPEVVPVPEPGTWSLFAAGLGILAWRRRNTRG